MGKKLLLRSVMALVGGAALTVAGWGQGAGGADSKPSATSPESRPAPGAAEKLLEQLNSNNRDEQAEARKQLAGIANLIGNPEILQKLGEQASDPALRTFYLQQARELKTRRERQQANNLRPISVHLKRATLAEAIHEINAELGEPAKLELRTGNLPLTGTVTLDMEAKPFWEVMLALREQVPVSLTGRGDNQLVLEKSKGGGIDKFVVNGPAMVYVTRVIRTLHYQETGGPGTVANLGALANVEVDLTIVIDPRLKVASCRPPENVVAKDDLGQALVKPTAINAGATIAQMAPPPAPARAGVAATPSAPTNVRTQRIALNHTGAPAKTITVAWDTEIEAGNPEQIIAINDVEKSVGVPLVIMDHEIEITGVKADPRGQVTFTDRGAQAAAANRDRVTFVLRDAAGKGMNPSTSSIPRRGVVGTDYVVNLPVGNAGGPFKLEVHVPGGPVVIPLHFELKDLPLP